MRKIIQEGQDPFAERPPLMKRVRKGLAIAAAVIVVAIGGLAWFRFQPAFSNESRAVIKVEQPAWGTAPALAPRAADTTAAAPLPVAVGSDSQSKAGGKERGKSKTQAAKPRTHVSKMPSQVAKTPTED